MTPEHKAELTGDIQRGDDSDHDRLAASGRLTQDEKRVKIAEACGWKKDYPCVDDYENEGLAWRKPDGSGPWGDSYLPDYFHDLNAMHEAERVLTDEQHFHFRMILLEITDSDTWGKRIVSSTATQRAEAFGKTLKLW